MKCIEEILKGVFPVFNPLTIVRTIIVHGGEKCHQDEMVACALAYATGAYATILRRNPTPEEIENPTVLVLDVGGIHDPSKLVFDHHQLERDAEPACAYSLLADFLGLSETLSKLFPWWTTGIVLDSKGPFQVAKAAGTEWDDIKGLLGPAASYTQELWVKSDDFRTEFTEWLAIQIKKALLGWEKAKAQVHLIPVAGKRCLDCRELSNELRDLQGALISEFRPQVVIFNDDRGDGLGLLRINDDPTIDFSKVDGRADIAFAHKGGFICKTTSKDVDLVSIVSAASVE